MRVPPQLRTRLVGDRELVHSVDSGEPRLRRRPVPTARGRRGRRRGGRRARAPFRRGAEQRPLALGEELLQELQLALDERAGVALEASELGGEGLDLGVGFRVLALTAT